MTEGEKYKIEVLKEIGMLFINQFYFYDAVFCLPTILLS